MPSIALLAFTDSLIAIVSNFKNKDLYDSFLISVLLFKLVITLDKEKSFEDIVDSFKNL